MRNLRFQFAPAASETWLQIQDRFPNGQATESAATVYYAVLASERDDLESGNLQVAEYRVAPLSGYPTDVYFCCYDNSKGGFGFIFRIRTNQRLFLVEEYYEGDEAPAPLVARYAA